MDHHDHRERQVASLGRRLAEAAAVELARLHLLYSEKFVREELLYPLMAIAPSAQRWQPTAEAPFEERKIRRASKGDIRRADLKFWRLDSRDPTPLEVIVEVKLLKSALPKRAKTLHATLAKIQCRHTKAAFAAAKANRQRYVVAVIVARLSANAARHAVDQPIDTSGHSALPRLLAESTVRGEFGTLAQAYLLCKNLKPGQSIARRRKYATTVERG
jgi:hypothetical protein